MLAKLIAENLATYGVGLEHCHVPGTEASGSRLSLDELELGMHLLEVLCTIATQCCHFA